MYAVVVYAVAVVVSARSRGRVFTLQTAAVALLIGLPLLVFVPVVMGERILGQRDISPLVYGAAGLVATVALSRGRLFDVVPMALSLVVEQSSEPVLAVDESARVVLANRRARDVLGLDGDPTGQPLAELGDRARTVWEAASEGGTRELVLGDRVFEVVTSKIRVRGDPRATLLRLEDATARRAQEQILREDKSRLEVAVSERTAELAAANSSLVRENAERKRAERAALDSEQKFRTIFDNAVEAIATVSPVGTVECANPAMLEVAGVGSESQLEGRALAEVIPWDADTSAAIRRAVAGVGARKLVSLDGRTVDGRAFEISLLPVTAESGATQLLVVECRDVTERLAADRERERLRERLALAERLEAIGRVAGAVAHDFNNYLAVVALSADVAKAQLGRGEPADEPLDTIHEVVASAKALVGQVLAFARREPLAPRVLDLGDAVRGFKDVLGGAAGDGVHVEIDVAPGAHAVEIDPAQLQQILMNLVVNARDAMPSGGAVGIAISSSVSAVELAVSDEGSGMLDEVAASAFEPFFSTKEGARGTGLGLATVHAAVTRAGGTIELATAPGSGTTFRITLPRVRTPVDASKLG
jgi:PAS domain S-box-containing protein